MICSLVTPSTSGPENISMVALSPSGTLVTSMLPFSSFGKSVMSINVSNPSLFFLTSSFDKS